MILEKDLYFSDPDKGFGKYFSFVNRRFSFCAPDNNDNAHLITFGRWSSHMSCCQLN